MDQTREHLEKPPATSTGIGADMKRLKSDASSTAEEVRDFIANIKGRSPQEVLGAVSESGLVQATIQATIGCVVVLGVLSVVPWALKSDEPAAVAAETQAAASEPTTAAAKNTATASSAETASTKPRSSTDTPTGSDATKAAAAMKIDETVVTDPKKNPLDGNLDKLLDGLD
ncbi:MAG: hypothetical protein HQ518_29465 [Rhodopirellula sp.]|nr:hypothetical protein [Rhodopirellula sp.]